MQNPPNEKAPVVLPPEAVDSEDPDKYTKEGPLYIPNGAPHQIFRFCRWGFEYGTDDKGHAASIILSISLLGLLFVLLVVGAFTDRSWVGDALKIIGTAFTFTAGVAIGKGSETNKNNDQ